MTVESGVPKVEDKLEVSLGGLRFSFLRSKGGGRLPPPNTNSDEFIASKYDDSLIFTNYLFFKY